MNDADGDFQIHLNEEQTNQHVIYQICVTYSSIPGQSSSKILSTHSHFIPHLASNFPKVRCGNLEKPCQPTGFIMTVGWSGWFVQKEPLKCVFGFL